MRSTTKPKTWLSFLKKGGLYTAITIILLEVLLRVTGYGAYIPSRVLPKEIHGRTSVQFDAQLGYTNKPGSFTYQTESGHTFTLSHDYLGARIPDTSQAAEIAFYGCSFTYGYGVNNKETYPFYAGEILQKKVRNVGCNGYGLVQAYLKLKSDFEAGLVPKTVVYSYASFQNQRTLCTEAWQQELFASGVLSLHSRLRIPYASSPDPLRIEYLQPKRQYSTLSEYSSIVYRIERVLLNDGTPEYGNKVALALLQEMHQLCKKHKVDFVVVGLLDDPETMTVLQKSKRLGMQTCQFHVDLKKKQNNLLPDDGHPSPIAYRQFAETLNRCLNRSE